VQPDVTITFNGNAASGSQVSGVPADIVVSRGAAASAPSSTPLRTGYDFVAWYGDEEGTGSAYAFDVPVEASFTLYAKWQIKRFGVTFEANLPSGQVLKPGTMPEDMSNVAYGSKITISREPEVEGYGFVEWTRDRAGTMRFDPGNDVVTGNITLYAQWRSYGGSEIVADPGTGIEVSGDFLYAPDSLTVTEIAQGSATENSVRTGYDGTYGPIDGYDFSKGYEVNAVAVNAPDGHAVAKNGAYITVVLPVPAGLNGKQALVLHQFQTVVNTPDGKAWNPGDVESFGPVVSGDEVAVKVYAFSPFTVYIKKDDVPPPPGPEPPGPTPPASDVVKATAVTIAGAPAQFAYKASGQGNTLQLSASVAPANAAAKDISWASAPSSVASVDQSGLVTFLGPEGDVKITATATDGSGVTGEVTIKAVKNVTSIRTPLTKLSLQKGKSLTLPVVLDDSSKPGTAVSSKLEWQSSNTKVLTVANGVIKANKQVKKKTNVTVTVKAANGRSLSINVVVVPKAAKLSKITATFPKNNVMKRGATYLLKVKLSKATATGVKVTFASSRKSVIRVDKAGKLIALKKGKATITVKAAGKSIKKKITVR
jgi:uncharacterized repeat protein (TIGR02543 family)